MIWRMMTSQQMLDEHRKALAHHEAEAAKHRAAITALEGKAPVPFPVPYPVVPYPNPGDVQPVVPLVPGGPWPGVGPLTPIWVGGHGGNCACSQCCPPLWAIGITCGPSPIAPMPSGAPIPAWAWSGTLDGATAIAAIVEAGGRVDINCNPGLPPGIPLFPKLGTFGPGPSMPPSDQRYGSS